MKARHHDVKIISAGSSLKFCLLAEGKQMYIRDLVPQWNETQQQGKQLWSRQEERY
jgi:3'-phosphoadenosine 5'-phosphosulfate (PAPS) 3'-phosphatase